MKKENTISGVIASGFAFEIDRDALDNMELVDALADLTDGNALALSRVCTLILGKEQKKALYDHLRNDSGRVSAKDMEQALTEILSAAGGQGKNS